MFAFFNGGLKSACVFLRKKRRESHINLFPIFIWADGIRQTDEVQDEHWISMKYFPT